MDPGVMHPNASSVLNATRSLNISEGIGSNIDLMNSVMTQSVTLVPLVTSSNFFGRLIHVSVKVGYSLGLLVTGLVGLLWYFQEKLLFHPRAPQGLETPDRNPHPFQHPGQMGMSYEDVYINTHDGCKLHAWFIKQKSPVDYTVVPTLIFFQGNAGNMGFRLANLLRLYQNCRLNIMAISYRGYGYSTGVPSEIGVYDDAEAALDYLLTRDDIDRSKIVVFGRSIGGAVAIDLGVKRSKELRAIIVENTFTSLRDMVDIVFPFLKYVSALVTVAQRLFMDSLSKIPSLNIPIMFISGLQDALVPPSQVARLYDNSIASPYRYLYPVANGTHNDTWQAGSHYYTEILQFITKALSYSPDDSTHHGRSYKKGIDGTPANDSLKPALGRGEVVAEHHSRDKTAERSLLLTDRVEL